MPQGDKSKYTDKQKRKADHIADCYEARGIPEKEAEQRASNHQDPDLRRANLWSEAVELLTEATSEFPTLLQSLDDIVSGVENAPTPLNEICTIVAAEAIDKHDRKLAKNSAFNR